MGKNRLTLKLPYFLPSSGGVMLTDTRIKTAKPQAKLYKLADERGLHL